MIRQLVASGGQGLNAEVQTLTTLPKDEAGKKFEARLITQIAALAESSRVAITRSVKRKRGFSRPVADMAFSSCIQHSNGDIELTAYSHRNGATISVLAGPDQGSITVLETLDKPRPVKAVKAPKVPKAPKAPKADKAAAPAK